MKVSEERPLTPEEASQCRSVAEKVLSNLKVTNDTAFAADDDTTAVQVDSWIRGGSNNANNNNNNNNNKGWLIGRTKNCRYFDTNGFLVVSNFANSDVVQSLKQQMADLVDKNWDPTNEGDINTFGTDEKSNTARGDYFLDSSNRVHYFAEPLAVLKQQDDDKLSILNKAGHGMHNIKGAFQDYTLSEKMKNLVLELGWIDPVVPQSMYIFKQAKIGGKRMLYLLLLLLLGFVTILCAVTHSHTRSLIPKKIITGTVHSHQDSTFLFTTPRQTCLGYVCLSFIFIVLINWESYLYIVLLFSQKFLKVFVKFRQYLINIWKKNLAF